MKNKNNVTRMAICYDFDRTLSPDDMQTFTLIPSFGVDAEDFWGESDKLARTNLMDKNLAWMFELIKYSKFKGKSLSRDYFKSIGAEVLLYDGVEGWFEHINRYAEQHGIECEHYIISSGLKEIIEGSPIAKYIKRIYASSYLYSADGIAEWPAQVVNYTTKTQFIFRIAKGYLEEYDERVNDNMPHSELRIPYDNIVYIGDSATDIPSMRTVMRKGGYSIGVYDPQSNDRRKVHQLFNDGRLNYFAPAKYHPTSRITKYLHQIIDEIEVRTKMREEWEKLNSDARRTFESSVIKNVLCTRCNSITEEERRVIEGALESIERQRAEENPEE